VIYETEFTFTDSGNFGYFLPAICKKKSKTGLH